MKTYMITFVTGESQRARGFTGEAESEGEAIEIFEDYAERFDDGYDFVSICEIE